MAVLGNPKNTIEVLNKYHFVFQKKYGQDFLIDTHALDKIIAAAEITKDDMVLEIGPGIGTMTQYLCENAREVVAVEIDKKLIPILEDTLSEYDNITVINEDILKVDIKKLADEKRKQEKQLTDSDGQLFSAIKGKKKTGPEADLFQPENQKLSKFESNVEDNSASLSDFIPALQMLAWSALLFGIAGYISYRIYRKEA